MGIEISELKQKERELQEKNAELERFTYAISHDLKSPLVTVKTFLGYLEQDLARLDTERIAQDMLYMRTAADKMGRLLDELVEMSRLGRLANPPEHIMFADLVGEALNAVAGVLTQWGVEVRVGEEAIEFFGDRPRLVEIWQNLVENAVKFMGDQPSPCIEIGADRHGGAPVFFVRDNGIGIDPRHQAKVFGLFEKLDPRSEGTGLGLALVKQIVELYQGNIWLESEGHGRGACFKFTLPKAMADQPGEVQS
jgi:signal transduction histidine kinase